MHFAFRASTSPPDTDSPQRYIQLMTQARRSRSDRNGVTDDDDKTNGSISSSLALTRASMAFARTAWWRSDLEPLAKPGRDHSYTDRRASPFPADSPKEPLTVPSVMFHDVLADLIDRSPLTQREIAMKLDYEKQNIITMFKKGHTKVPITKIGPLARILEVDPVWLLRRALKEYNPGLWEALEETLGHRVTSNEAEILAALREATDDTDPRLSGPAAKVKVEELAAVLTA
jgi:hypothetical protein